MSCDVMKCGEVRLDAMALRSSLRIALSVAMILSNTHHSLSPPLVQCRGKPKPSHRKGLISDPPSRCATGRCLARWVSEKSSSELGVVGDGNDRGYQSIGQLFALKVFAVQGNPSHTTHTRDGRDEYPLLAVSPNIETRFLDYVTIYSSGRDEPAGECHAYEVCEAAFHCRQHHHNRSSHWIVGAVDSKTSLVSGNGDTRPAEEARSSSIRLRMQSFISVSGTL